MDEDEFEKTRAVQEASEHPVDRDPHSGTAEHSAFAATHRQRREANPKRGGAAELAPASFERPGIVWVRASDLLNTGSGRVAGRGLDFQAEFARRMRRTPAETRRAIRDRADRLPPLSAFGQQSNHPLVIRYGFGRR